MPNPYDSIDNLYIKASFGAFLSLLSVTYRLQVILLQDFFMQHLFVFQNTFETQNNQN